MFSLGYTAKDGSFYASLRAGFAQQDRGFAQQDGVVSQVGKVLMPFNYIFAKKNGNINSVL